MKRSVLLVLAMCLLIGGCQSAYGGRTDEKPAQPGSMKQSTIDPATGQVVKEKPPQGLLP